jgi:hypothetical protein
MFKKSINYVTIIENLYKQQAHINHELLKEKENFRNRKYAVKTTQG